MKRRARTVIFVLLACCAALGTAVFLWLPWNPFEADAGALDAWVPADVDAVIRFDAAGLRDASAVRKLWDGPAGRRLRSDFDLDARLADVKRLDDEIAAAPFVGRDPPTVERDLIGGEVLVALRGDDVLAMSRISPRAKAVDLLRRAGDERRARWGIRIDGDAYVVSVGDGRDARFARRRDVLLASTSRELLAAALALADGRGASIANDAEWRAAAPPVPSGAKAGAWISGRFAAGVVGKNAFVERASRGAFEHGAVVDVDLAAPSVSIRARGGVAGDVGAVADEAARLAVSGGDAIASGAMPISAHDAVATLFDAQPDARRDLADEALAAAGTSVDEVVSDLSRHFEDGVGFVVARLAQTDRLRLDDPDGDPVEPIPATMAVFRLRDADARPFMADLRRRATALFGAGVRLVEDARPDGADSLVVAEAPLGPEWALLRPALAVKGRMVVFSTNDWYLRHALRHVAWTDVSTKCVAALRIDAALLKRRLDDLRWEAADRATSRGRDDERRALRTDLARSRPTASAKDLDAAADAEIARRVAERRRRLFPEAVRAYRDSIRWLNAFQGADVRAWDDAGTLRIDAGVGVR